MSVQRRRTSPLARIFWLGCLVAALACVVYVVRQTQTPDPAVSASAPEACSEVDLSGVGERMTCRSSSAILTVAGERHPVVVDRTEARVLDSRITRRVLTVRLRLRNDTASTVDGTLGRRQVYVNVAGRRYWPQPTVARRRTRESVPTLSLRFVLGRRDARRVRRGRARPDLGIVPWDELGRDAPDRLGVVRLSPA